MGIVLIQYSSIFITWLCLLCCSNAKAYAANSQGGESRENYHVIKMNTISISQAPVCSAPHTHDGGSSDVSSLKIFHKYGHCSKSHNLNRFSDEKTKSIDETLDDDQFYLPEQLRVNSIQSKLSKSINSKQLQRQNSKAFSVPTYSGIPLGTGNYYVTIGFGTPKRDMSLIFDTGSDFTWIQCSPCVISCHLQQEPIFDPTKSTTYSNISCNTAVCISVLRSATSANPGCSSSTCIYGIQYGDSSFSVGFLASEKVTITPRDSIPDFVFGCGENNNGLFGKTAGLLGLGRNLLSFVSQTSKKYGQLFSYCLPSKLNSTGYLTFGKDKLKSKVKYTPLLSDSRGPSFYFLDLISISVGGTKLSIPTSVFKTSGTIIDSGTVITRLPPSAYSKLRSTFRSFMSDYNLTQSTRLLDTCYDLSSHDTVSVPKVTLYFSGGAELDVGFSGILVGAPSLSCLAFAGNQDDKDVAILGNRQQETYKVIHDVSGKRLAFSPGGCT